MRNTLNCLQQILQICTINERGKKMKQEQIKLVFEPINEAISILQKDLKSTNVESLVETFDNLINETVKVENDAPSKEVVTKLTALYKQADFNNQAADLKETVFSLAVMKAQKDDGLHYNQQSTPKAISIVLGLLIQKINPAFATQIIEDPAIGTGQLLFNTIEELHDPRNTATPTLIGIDNDETLLDIADLNAKIRAVPVELYHQDGLEDWVGQKPQMVISDLPVGYYPNDENAKKFELHEAVGHSLAHELFVQQIVQNLDDDGFAFLVVPAVLLNSENATTFVKWLTKKTYLQAIIDLPGDLFVDQQMQKNILVLQKHGSKGRQAHEILLAKLGSLHEKKSLIEFNVKLNEWYKNNLI